MHPQRVTRRIYKSSSTVSSFSTVFSYSAFSLLDISTNGERSARPVERVLCFLQSLKATKRKVTLLAQSLLQQEQMFGNRGNRARTMQLEGISTAPSVAFAAFAVATEEIHQWSKVSRSCAPSRSPLLVGTADSSRKLHQMAPSPRFVCLAQR